MGQHHPTVIVHSLSELRERVAEWKKNGDSIAFVPTMGNLHKGHLSLVKAANERASRTIVSIFVNPLQFSADEDFSTYPRTFEEDVSKLKEYEVDIVFSPELESVYPDGDRESTFVEVPAFTSQIEGEVRPVFFRGISTVVNKLFNMVQPDIALFGEKDYQQLLVIRQMVADLSMSIDIQSVATVREADGLAMSSRNNYLTASQRKQSALLYASLCTLRDLVQQGMQIELAESKISQQLLDQGFDVDYLTIREPKRLKRPISRLKSKNHKSNYKLKEFDNSLIILVGARLGETRLIDNLQFRLNDLNG